MIVADNSVVLEADTRKMRGKIKKNLLLAVHGVETRAGLEELSSGEDIFRLFAPRCIPGWRQAVHHSRYFAWIGGVAIVCPAKDGVKRWAWSSADSSGSGFRLFYKSLS